MAKEVTCTVDAPMSEELAVKLWQFLVDATARRKNVTVTGSVRRVSTEAGTEAS